MNTIAHTARNCPRHPDLDGPRACRTCADARLAAVQAAYVELAGTVALLREQNRDDAKRSYQLGREHGDAEGYERCEADHRRAWQVFAAPAAATGPTWDEYEIRRYGPGGRARFADPRPGDRPGREPRARRNGVPGPMITHRRPKRAAS